MVKLANVIHIKKEVGENKDQQTRLFSDTNSINTTSNLIVENTEIINGKNNLQF